MKTKEKLYKNVNGEYLYLFNWVEGGFNDVWAPNKREAYRRVVNDRKDWHNIWLTFAAYAAVITIAFAIMFKHKHDPKDISKISH